MPSGRIKEIDLYKFDIEHVVYTDVYQSIDELKEAEARGEGKINWKYWSQLCEKTKKQIEKELKKYKPPTNRKTIYVFNLSGKLLHTFRDSTEASETLKIPMVMITNYCRRKRPYWAKNIYFSYIKKPFIPIDERKN